MKKNNKKNSRFWIKLSIIILLLCFSMWTSYVFGESSGGSPESGSTSYIKSIYTDLQTSGYGSDTASPDWGTYWNRIKTSALWLPTNTTVDAIDVKSGKTFYSTSRTLQTGTLQKLGYCPTQLYDDSDVRSDQTTNCTNTITWTVPTDNIPGTGKQDPISGLIWSIPLYKDLNNNVVFYIDSPTTWSWDASSPNNIAVGNKTASQLCSERGNGWRLPTQKEIIQAYIDGLNYNLSWSRIYSFASLTEGLNSVVYSFDRMGGSTAVLKSSNSNGIRCVR